MPRNASCWLWLLVLLMHGAGSRAQTPATSTLDSLRAQYPFLQPAYHTIHNDTLGLQAFYQKLLLLRQGLVPTVAVVHIGDSHVQADMFTGRVRRELQLAYGNAGRGLVFPYQVARTNGPWDYKSTSATRWQVRRVIGRDTTLAVGLSGLTLATPDTGAAIGLQCRSLQRLDYRFNKLTVIRPPVPAAYAWRVTDAYGRLLGVVPGDNGRLGTVLRTDSLLTTINLTAHRTAPAQTQATLYGLVLENGQPGILYHAIGVNGAALRHYNAAAGFAEQLPLLAPDLIVVSLGTNDAYAPGFDAEAFGRELAALVGSLRRQCPAAAILLTTPPDSYRGRRYRNPDVQRARALLLRYAREHDLACWDFYGLMGGPGAMRLWRQAGLAQADLVHLTPKGYDLQGLLLYTALQDELDRFAAARRQ